MHLSMSSLVNFDLVRDWELDFKSTGFGRLLLVSVFHKNTFFKKK